MMITIGFNKVFAIDISICPQKEVTNYVNDYRYNTIMIIVSIVFLILCFISFMIMAKKLF